MTTIHILNGNYQRDSHGNFVLATGLEYAQQRVLEFLRFVSGEWFLNPSLGIPYIYTPLTYTFVNALLEGPQNLSIESGATANRLSRKSIIHIYKHG